MSVQRIVNVRAVLNTLLVKVLSSVRSRICDSIADTALQRPSVVPSAPRQIQTLPIRHSVTKPDPLTPRVPHHLCIWSAQLKSALLMFPT